MTTVPDMVRIDSMIRPVEACTVGLGNFIRSCEYKYEGSVFFGVLGLMILIAGIWTLIRLNK